jgi:hypothetical protein
LTKNDLNRALVSYAIENALIEYGDSALEEVYYKLYREHGLHLVDCYNNPEIFRKVLLGTFGDSYAKIVELVQKNLGKHIAQKGVTEFLSAIR